MHKRSSFCRRLLAGVALACVAREPADAQGASEKRQDILVVGKRILLPELQGVEPERTYGEEEVASHGSDTVGDIVSDVEAENGDEEPVFLVNGNQVSGIDDVADYPAEAISRIEVLPRGSGQKLGQAPGSRVYNIVLKPQMRSATASAAVLAPTDGGLTQERGEAILTRIRGAQRMNLALRVRNNDALFESDRGLIQPTQAYPYSVSGNVLPYPLGTGEIDPALSALAGHGASMAAAPQGNTSPALADFDVGHVDALDEAPYRTLRPASRTYEGSVSFGDRFGPHLTGSFNARLAHTEDRGLLGLPKGLFVLTAASPSSPFGNDVTLALAGPQPERNRSNATNGSAEGTLDYVRGAWQGNVQLHYDSYDRTTSIERQANLPETPVTLPIGFDPFGGDNRVLFPLAADSISSRVSNARGTAQLSGPLAKLPAGFLRIRGRSEFLRSTLDGERRGVSGTTKTRFARDVTTAQVGLDVPLASRAFGSLAWLGEMSASAEFARSYLSHQGTFDRQTYALAWQPLPQINLSGSFSRAEQPLDADLLANPVEIYDNVRVFDPLTGDTVEVRQITGGNPALRTPVVRETLLSAGVSPWKAHDIRFDVSFRETSTKGAASYLAPASSDILAAFPHRFQRDADGRLVLVDVRPVSLAAQRRQELKTGVSMVLPVGKKAGSPGQTTVQLSLADLYVLRDGVTLVTGRPPIDLLHGGALGFGGGSRRHFVTATAGIGNRAWGVRVTADWRTGSRLNTGTAALPEQLRFRPIFQESVRVFADLGPLIPAEWLKNTRLSLSVTNVGNSRQQVIDNAGLTPLRYQPGYLDPLGRTFEIELRKVF